MSLTIDQDSLQSTSFGYLFLQGEAVTVAAGVVVSSTENVGVYSAAANSHLINNGYIVSAASAGHKGVGVEFDQNDGSILNAANASITGFETGVKFTGNQLVLTNYGTIRGLDSAGDYSGFGVFFDARQNTVTGSLTIVNGVGGVIAGDWVSIEVLGLESGRFLLDNRGSLDGSVYSGKTNDVVINRGAINGLVGLGAGNDVFNGAGGKSGLVYGGEGRDTLAGGNRADWLDGAEGVDILTGRGGADRFVFDTALNAAVNTDRIIDFTVNTDKIVLYKGFDHFLDVGSPGVLGAARFHVGPAAADASDRIIYNANTGALFYDHDGRGGDAQIRFAVLTTHLALDHADFVVALIEA